MTATDATSEPTPSPDLFVCSSWGGKLALRVGDEVGVSSGNFGVPKVLTVARITHKGRRARMSDGREFNERGSPVGSDSWSRANLMSAEKARREADPKNNLRAFDHAIGHLRDKLSAILRTHAAAEEFTPLTDTERAELMALIEKM